MPTDSVRKNSKHTYNRPPDEISSAVNFVLNKSPQKPYPLNIAFEESQVEQGLDDFFSLENIGISEKCSTYDDNILEEFEKSVTFQGGKYHVFLPWHQDILREVPSNFEICKILAKKVHHKNSQQGIDLPYLNVCRDQLTAGIIEEINDDDHESHHWIPHRLLVKEDNLTTTKIRPVFNCNFCYNNSPSLNQAAYPGTDLMNSLFDFLLHSDRINLC